MPIYEFRCQACRKFVRLRIAYADYETAVPACPHCHSTELKRHIRRVALAKSEDARMDGLLDDSAMAGLDEDDPQSIGKFMRKMGTEMGEDLGDEFHEVVDRLEKGQSPEAIEKAMPDLGADDGPAGDMDF